MGELRGWTLLIIAGMTVITVLTRCGFFFSDRDLQLPRWLQRGLPYAPIAALTAAIAPDSVMPGGHWVLPLTSAQAWGALVTAGWCFWRRNDRQALTVSILVGLAVYLVLRVGFGL